MKYFPPLALILGIATAQSCNTNSVCNIVQGCAVAVSEMDKANNFCAYYVRKTSTKTVTTLAKASTITQTKIVTVTGTSSLTTTTTILASPVMYTTTAACAPTTNQASSTVTTDMGTFTAPALKARATTTSPSSSVPTGPAPSQFSSTGAPSCIVYGAWLNGGKAAQISAACNCLSFAQLSPLTTAITATATPSPVTATRFGTVHLYTQVVKVISTTISPTYTVVMDADPNFCATQTGGNPTSSSGTITASSSTASDGTPTTSITTSSSSSSTSSATSSSSQTSSSSSSSSTSSQTSSSSTLSTSSSSSSSSISSSSSSSSSSTTSSPTPAPTSTNLVQDFSFEQDQVSSFGKRTTTTSPWSLPFDSNAGGANIATNSNPGVLGKTPAGNQFAILDPGFEQFENGTVAQTINGMTPGAPHNFTFLEAKQFSMNKSPNVQCGFTLTLPGQSPMQYERWGPGRGQSGYAWHSNGWTFTPTVSSGLLAFAHWCNGTLGDGDYSFYGIDAVQLVPLPYDV